MILLGIALCISFLIAALILAILRKGKTKLCFALSGIGLVFFIIGAAMPTKEPVSSELSQNVSSLGKDVQATNNYGSNQESDDDNKNSTEIAPTAYSEDEMKLAREFDKNIAYIENENIVNIKRVDEIINQLKEGTTDDFQAYSELNSIKAQFDNASTSLNSLEISTDINKELRDVLEEIKLYESLYYDSHSRALTHFLKFLDDPKPSHMDDMKKELELTRSYNEKCRLQLSILYSIIGIPDDLNKESTQ